MACDVDEGVLIVDDVSAVGSVDVHGVDSSCFDLIMMVGVIKMKLCIFL